MNQKPIRLRVALCVIASMIFAAIVVPLSRAETAPSPNVPNRYRGFFVKYGTGRSLPSSVLTERGIPDGKVGRSFALVAGISHYSHLPAEKQLLAPAEVDVNQLVQYLEKHEYFDEIVVLKDTDVTLDNLNYFLGVYFPNRMDEGEQNSRFLFAYSGHGFDYGTDGYLLTSAAEQMDDRTNSIDLAQLKIAVEKSAAKALNTLVLINSCQGGVFLGSITFGQEPLVVTKFGAHAITAGTKGQFTYGPRDEGHGSYFFEEVLNGLKGAADTKNEGFITAEQLWVFVRHEVEVDTKYDQDPDYGDLEPHRSEGVFFFVVPRTEATDRKIRLDRNGTSTGTKTSAAGNERDPDCLGAQELDSYTYAVANNFQDEFLRSLDQESWERLKAVGVGDSALFSSGKSFLGGQFSLSDDYATFDQKRSEHLKNVFYSKTVDQARAALQETVSTREYPSYRKCMESLISPSPTFNVFAERETLDEIQLVIRYAGANNAQLSPTGIIEGGTVGGLPAGSLWDRPPVWDITKREHHFVIRRDPNAAQTTVTVRSLGTTMPSIKNFKRADAILTMTYTGTADSQATRRRVDAPTPDNNENRGHCPNEVGLHDGKYCTSRTTLTLTTTPPHVLKNAKIDCSGAGCPWGSIGPVTISADGLTATGYVENWGSSITATLTADEYEKIFPDQCGAESSVPIIKGRPVLLGIRKECVSLAMIKWTLLPDFSQGLFHFGDKESAGGEFAMNGSLLQNDTAVFASYSLKRNEQTNAANASEKSQAVLKLARDEANRGWWHETGQIGGGKDYEAAMRWYLKAVEDGDALANWNIGRLYEFGFGVPKDLAVAKSWYQKAADKGVLEAQDSLANLGHNKEY